MISVSHLTRSYGPHRGVEDISFEVKEGEVVGLLGPNGAGKTTTIRVLTTNLLPSAGSVKVCGLDAVADPMAVRSVLGYLPENAPSYREMITRDYLLFTAELRGLDGVRAKDSLKRVVEQCSLADVIGRPIDELSKGYRQRVGLAAALIHSPRVLVLDEPTAGLDPNQVVEMRKLIREVGRHNTVIFSSHILQEVELTCDRILIVHNGRLVADSKPSDLRSSHRVRVEIRADEAKIRAALKGFSCTAFEPVPGGLLRFEVSGGGTPARREEIAQKLVAAGLTPSTLGPGQHELEEVFAQLTGARA
ncbi:MAG: ABC transporter ATP-binding protein [Planctomycetota bacterium]